MRRPLQLYCRRAAYVVVREWALILRDVDDNAGNHITYGHTINYVRNDNNNRLC